MIISHQHKYVFVELPHTASTAISKELRENYSGEPILYKHSAYYEFTKIASPEEKKYFVFSGIRNPIDDLVSRYFKYKTNHNENYTNPERWKKNGGWIPAHQIKEYNDIVKNDLDFSGFFQRHCKLTYDNWSSLEHHNFDFVIHFENLQNDFQTVLNLIGIEPKRDLPQVNKTSEKEQDPFSYFSPETFQQAKEVLGPFMEKWGYEFPSEWGDASVPPMRQIEFQLLGIPRKFYWRYIKKQRGLGMPPVHVQVASDLDS